MGQIKAALTRNNPRDLTIPETLVAGGGAGFFVSFVLTPIELIKCRMQMGNGMYSGTLDCITKSVKSEGPGVFFKGLTATCLREVPGTAGWFGAYESFVRLL